MATVVAAEHGIAPSLLRCRREKHTPGQRFTRPLGGNMREKAEATVASGGKGRAGNSSVNPDYISLRRSAYEVCLDDALDDLARKAIVLAFRAGICAGLPDVSDEHATDMAGLADGVADRLNERCRAYETILRTTPVPELRDGRR